MRIIPLTTCSTIFIVIVFFLLVVAFLLLANIITVILNYHHCNQEQLFWLFFFFFKVFSHSHHSHCQRYRYYHVATWTSKMAKTMDPILPVLSMLEYWAMILGSFGGPGTYYSFRLLPRLSWSRLGLLGLSPRDETHGHSASPGSQILL